MKINISQQTEFDINIRMSQEEAEALATLLYQATSDLLPNQHQLLVANSLIAAFKGYWEGGE